MEGIYKLKTNKEMNTKVIEYLKEHIEASTSYLEDYAREQDTSLDRVLKGNWINDDETHRAYDLAILELSTHIIKMMEGGKSTQEQIQANQDVLGSFDVNGDAI